MFTHNKAPSDNKRKILAKTIYFCETLKNELSDAIDIFSYFLLPFWPFFHGKKLFEGGGEEKNSSNM